MIIDSHQHIFWHGRNDKDLVNDMKENSIHHSWLLTWEIPTDHDDKTYHSVLNPIHMKSDGTHSGIPLSDLVKASDMNKKKFSLGYCPDPRLESASDLFEAAVKMFGVKICGEWKFRINIDDISCIRLFEKAGELNCPVVLHLDVPWLYTSKGKEFQKNWFGGTIKNLNSLLLACPDVNFVGHGPGFWREISGDASESPDLYPNTPIKKEGSIQKLFNKHSNLYADLSAGSGLNAIRRDKIYAKTFIEDFSDRLLFGRDYFGSELIKTINELELAGSVKESVLSKNAMKLVKIDI
ncbi:MAG: hypothetical protein CMG75_04780 [Candidatus Marinimicrobia bacterium]|nr:hypothetical protein [Candidatus Neomarinimicrobiota bacterium]|tara:strand:- start:1195 stop:2079 length:885 start_codon:yes stop_codon:yes gene_type:complete